MEVFGRLLTGSRDVLSGYRVAPIEIKDKTFLSRGEQEDQRTLVPSNDKKHAVEGTVFEISEEELLLSDKYEPDGYKRFKVTLKSGRQAWVYLAAE